jgi:glycosyltransferase involved in cell wall biosynthesis
MLKMGERVQDGRNNRPLVTLYVLSYNRRTYIRSALESAFAQTYSPLEIVISDNCSTDGTFEIISEMVVAYKGPHTIVVNRNETNIGLIGNVNKVFSLARGELLVMQCDDDISLPCRVEILVEEWCRVDRQPYVVCSSYTYLRRDGSQCDRQRFSWGKTGIESRSIEEVLLHYAYRGSSAAYRPEVMTAFGEVVVDGCYDDMVLFSRGRMLGNILLIKDSLLLYREGGLSANTGTVESAFLKKAAAERASYLQVMQDIFRRSEQGHLSDGRRDELVAICQKIIEDVDCRVRLLTGGLRERIGAYRHLIRNPEGQPKTMLFLISIFPRLLTRWIVWLHFKIKRWRGEVL